MLQNNAVYRYHGFSVTVCYRRAFLDTAHLSAQPVGLQVTSHIRRFRHNLAVVVCVCQTGAISVLKTLAVSHHYIHREPKKRLPAVCLAAVC